MHIILTHDMVAARNWSVIFPTKLNNLDLSLGQVGFN